jgi:hypothetical protein
MLYSITQATGTGSAQILAVPEYLDPTHITVYVDSLATTAFSWITGSTISVTAGAGHPVRVVRTTSPGTRLSKYLDGQGLPASSLELDSKQAFYLAQEALDLAFLGGSAVGTPMAGLENTQAGLLALLNGTLGLSQLAADLRAKIGLIDADSTVAGSVAAKVLAETSARIAAVQAELDARNAALNQEAQNRGAAITAATLVQKGITDSLAQSVTTLTASTGANTAAIQSEVTTRTNADSALAQSITTLTTRVGNNESAVTTEAQARTTADSALASRVDYVRAGNSLGTLTQDPNAQGGIEFWDPGAATLVAGSQLGRKAFHATIATDCVPRTWIPVDLTRLYRVSGRFRRSADAGPYRTAYLVVRLVDSSGATIGGDGTYWFYPTGGFQPQEAWTGYTAVFGAGSARPFPSNAVQMQVSAILQYNSTGAAPLVGWHECEFLRIEDNEAARTVGVVAAAVTDETSARISAVGAVASRVTTLEASYASGGGYNDTEVRSLITNETSARATADSALAGRTNTLETKVDVGAGKTVEGRLLEVGTAAATATSSVATRATTLESKVNLPAGQTVTGLIADEATTRASADQANATNITTLQSSITGPGGVVSRLASVESSASTLSTSMGAVSAQFTLKVQARSDNLLAIAGIGLASTSNGPAGAAQSQMVFLADQFQFVPSAADINGTPQPLLQLGTVNGATSLVIPAQRYGDQSIGANVLIDGSITATKMVANLMQADNVLTRGLTVRDIFGNVILGSGTALPTNYVTPSPGWLNSNVTATSIGAVKTDLGNAPSGILNSTITVAGSRLYGIGAGSGTLVDNELIQLGANGTLTGAGGGQVTYSGIGGKALGLLDHITPANSQTYILAAAITNAQIGGDIFSDNYVSGVSGWRIYRNGYAELGNVRVRGDVQATSLNGQLVGTANIQDGAISNVIPAQLGSSTLVGQGAAALSCYITTTGGKLLVDVDWDTSIGAPQNTSTSATFDIRLDGSTVRTHTVTVTNPYSTGSVRQFIATASRKYVALSLPPGSHYVELVLTSAAAVTVQAGSTIVLMELKK